MSSTKKQFIELALKHNILRFGEFTLKSGRISPYFFNAGLFHHGQSLMQLGEFYSNTILNANIHFDVLFGPAYKGIPLATATAIALANTNTNIAVSFNRKEVKTHGEGGQLIGAPLSGNVLMIDDVITAGTAFRESKHLIESHGARICGVIVALDRQEKGLTDISAIQQIEQEYGIPVLSIITLDDLINYLTKNQKGDILNKINDYKSRYGVEAK
jgi:orotate phosphoribosyltransferase